MPDSTNISNLQKQNIRLITTETSDNNLQKINFNSFEKQSNKITNSTNLQNNQHLQNNISQNDLNKLISNLQVASQNGMTQLQNRHIPKNTINITNDQYIKPNHIPIEEICNIKNFEESEFKEIKQKKIYSTKTMFEKIKIPLIGLIVFLSIQSNFINNMLLKYIPFIKSNNLINNLLKGSLFMSLFSLLLYLVNNINDF